MVSGRPIKKALLALPCALGATWSLLFIVTHPETQHWQLNPLGDGNYPLVYYSQAALIVLCLILPVLHLLKTKPERSVRIYLFGTLSLCLFMLVGDLFQAWELYYAGSSLTALSWGWAAFSDIQETNRRVEQHARHEKALAKAQFASAQQNSFSDYYPTEQDMAYPFRERDELVEVVKTASGGLVDEKATELLKALSIFTHHQLGTMRVRCREVLFTLVDTAIFVGADAKELIATLESIGKTIEQCHDEGSLHRLMINECHQLVDRVANCSNQNRDLQLVEQVKECLRTEYYKDLSINDIASHVGASRSHIMRLFKEHTEQTINQYLTDIRIAKAKQLLLSRSVTETTFEVGFNNTTYFSTVFKKLTGLTPRQYQQQAKQSA
ncbi:helix-turn-helix transcriptional regulator [Neiella marina]|nr:AraC family transcriptional regulator [Neiella marina]